MSKCCPKCGETDVDKFNKNSSRKDGLQSMCRVCTNSLRRANYKQNPDKHKSYTKARKKQNRDLVQQIKRESICNNCGDDRWYVLDFHHNDKEGKEFSIGDLANSSISTKRLLEEIDKCIVLCSNCHRELHYLENIDAGVE